MDTVLFFGGSAAAMSALGAAHRMGDGEVHLTADDGGVARSLALLFEHDLQRAMRRLAARPVDVVVIDARAGDVPGGRADAAVFLERLFPAHASSGPARRARTLLLVDGDASGTQLAFLAGLKHLAGVMVGASDADVLARLFSLTARATHGKIAVCLAGGGIEGMLYEVGVLRALDQFFEASSIRDVDLFCGISAGSILGSFLANGLTPEEICQGMQFGGARLDKITRKDIFDPNFAEFGERLGGLFRDIVGRGEARNPLSGLTRAIPTAAFAGNSLRDYLRRQLDRPGMTDSFDRLRRPLYIGATDQDSSEAVLFGDDEWRHVPIHRAVRASCALAPFYAAEKIDGRYFLDGGFTRTTNMRVAVKQGATLVILIDPLVPIVSEVAGYVHKRGGVFSTMQGLKSLINGRFDKAANTIREMYPDVSFYLFRPEGDEMRILSGSPMKFLYRAEIEELAFQRTLRKIRAQLPEMSRDFGRHGVVFREPSRDDQRPSRAPGAMVAA